MGYKILFVMALPVLVFIGEFTAVAEPEVLTCDVCVVGGGSGGIGASLAAARAGAEIVLVEKRNILGGTSTAGYVCRWEPGPGCSFAREIFNQLQRIPGAVGITWRKSVKFGGLLITDPELTYDQTLCRAGLPSDKLHAVVFEPEAFHQVAWNLLSAAEKCHVLLQTTFMNVKTKGKHIESLCTKFVDGTVCKIKAKVFIDCTGGGHLCKKAGCEIMLGEDSRSRFNEPHAPEAPSMKLNAISLCYRVTKSSDAKNEELPLASKSEGWHKTASVHQLPCGDRIVNPLPLLPGRAIVDMGYQKAYETARQRAAAHWCWLQTFSEFNGYHFHSFAPILGIRESHRIVTDYILTEHDLITGLSKQKHNDIIAIADHPMDTHGEDGGLRGITSAYGIPYRCLIPKGYDNLLIACRGSGFSHIAASSCRLSRTMIAIGHAAGLGAAEAAIEDKCVREIKVPQLVQAMDVNRKQDHQ